MRYNPYMRVLADAEGAITSRSIVTACLVSCLLFGDGTYGLLVPLVVLEGSQGLGLVYAESFSERGITSGKFAPTARDRVVFLTWGALAAVSVYVNALVALQFAFSWFRCGGANETVLSLGGRSCLDLPLGAASIGTVCALLNLAGSPWFLSDVHNASFSSLGKGSIFTKWVALEAAAILQVLHLSLWSFETVARGFLAKLPLIGTAALCVAVLLALITLMVQTAHAPDNQVTAKYRGVAITSFCGGIVAAVSVLVLSAQVVSDFDAFDHVPILVLAFVSLVESVGGIVCVLTLYTEL